MASSYIVYFEVGKGCNNNFLKFQLFHQEFQKLQLLMQGSVPHIFGIPPNS